MSQIIPPPEILTNIEIKTRLDVAISTLKRNDKFLLEFSASEWSIAHKLAEYLQLQFPLWNVDIDYNRHFRKIKKYTNLEGVTIKPRLDITVHIRDQKNNLLLIELKKHNNQQNVDSDKERVIIFTSDIEYQYQLGLFLTLSMGIDWKNPPIMEFYSNGEEFNFI